MKRYGLITGLHPDKVDEYKKLHAAVWPDVLAKITECNLRNYSIYFREVPGVGPLLFSYFEYVGEDFDADMALMAADETTQKWWKVCTPCQRPIAEAELSGAWVGMDEVFHYE
jgi:L-rhamnose mutarotase